jgi:hypothetical protein
MQARVAILILSIAMFAGPQAAAAEKVESSPAGHRIVLDGDPSDWAGIPIIYLKDSLHVSAIAHDDDSLYLMYRFADDGLARRLLSRGVTLWINGDGKAKKKKEEFAVRYPGSAQIAEQFEDEEPVQDHYQAETGESGAAGRGEPPASLASLRQVPSELTVIRRGRKETVKEDDPAGPTAASAFNEGVFCYELKIPIAEIGGKVTNANPAKQRHVAIGVQIGGMTRAERETLQAAMKEKVGSVGGSGSRGGGMGGALPSGMGGGGIGGMGGGMSGMGGQGAGRGGGGQGGGGEDMRSRIEPEIKWLSVSLSGVMGKGPLPF